MIQRNPPYSFFSIEIEEESPDSQVEQWSAEGPSVESLRATRRRTGIKLSLAVIGAGAVTAMVVLLVKKRKKRYNR